MKGGRIVNIVFVMAFLAVGALASLYLYRDYQQLDHLESQKKTLEKRYEKLTEAANEKEETLEKLQGDSEYVERVIREKLNYAKEDENVFRFE